MITVTPTITTFCGIPVSPETADTLEKLITEHEQANKEENTMKIFKANETYASFNGYRVPQPEWNDDVETAKHSHVIVKDGEEIYFAAFEDDDDLYEALEEFFGSEADYSVFACDWYMPNKDYHYKNVLVDPRGFITEDYSITKTGAILKPVDEVINTLIGARGLIQMNSETAEFAIKLAASIIDYLYPNYERLYRNVHWNENSYNSIAELIASGDEMVDNMETMDYLRSFVGVFNDTLLYGLDPNDECAAEVMGIANCGWQTVYGLENWFNAESAVSAVEYSELSNEFEKLFMFANAAIA